MPVLQERNAEMNNILRADLLDLRDRNLVVDTYGDTEITLNPGPITLPIENTRFNMSTDLYTVDTNDITVNYKGLFQFSYRMGIGHNSGTSTAVVAFWLEYDNGGGWTELGGARAWVNVPTSDLGHGSLCFAENLVTAGILFRLRAERTTGADSLYVSRNRNLTIMSLYITEL